MKTYTITLHDTDNCGSTLQAYALQHFLLENNIENEIINYCPTYIYTNGSTIRAIVKKLVFLPFVILKRKKFVSFRQEFLILTKKVRNHKKIIKYVADGSVFITGSDQLWNDSFKCGKDPSYYLSFCDKKKIAYAISIAKDNNCLPENVKIYCNEFQWISLREKKYISDVKKIVSCEVSHTCDPVLLNNKCDYEKLCKKRIVKEKYIFIYIAQRINTEMLNFLISCVNKNNYKVIFGGSIIRRCKCDKHIIGVGPIEFLNLIKNAEFVISNSFHGTVFSLLFNKQFATILPDSNSCRIVDLLDELGIDNKDILIKENNYKLYKKREINYLPINKKIEEIKLKSREKLLKNIFD